MPQTTELLDFKSRREANPSSESDVELLKHFVTADHSLIDVIRILMSQARGFDPREVNDAVSKVSEIEKGEVSDTFDKMLTEGYFTQHAGGLYKLKPQLYYTNIPSINSGSVSNETKRSRKGRNRSIGTRVYDAFALYGADGASRERVMTDHFSGVDRFTMKEMINAVSNLRGRSSKPLYSLGRKPDSDGRMRQFYSVFPEHGIVNLHDTTNDVEKTTAPPKAKERKGISREQSIKLAAQDLLAAMRSIDIPLEHMKAISNIMKDHNVDAETACAMFLLT